MEVKVSQIVEFIKRDNELAELAPLINDTFVEHFLRWQKEDTEATKKHIKEYFRVRGEIHRNHLSQLPQITFTRFYEEGGWRFLKQRDNNGRHVMVFNTKKMCANPSSALEDSLRDHATFNEYFLQNKEYYDKGWTLVVDCREFSLKHLRLCSPTNMKISGSLQQVYPDQVKAVHILRSNSLLQAAVSIIMKLLPANASGAAQVHTSVKSVQEALGIPFSSLPEKLGGELKDDLAYDMEIPKKVLVGEKFQQELKRVFEQ